MALTDANKMEFVPAAAQETILPNFDWRSIGAVFAGNNRKESKGTGAVAKLTARCAVGVREGFDPIDESSTGRVIDGRGDAGITLRKGTFALSVTANNLAYRAGLDDPLAAAQTSVGESSVPSVKLTAAKEYNEDSYLAVSFDLTQKKPEFSLGWSGSTFTEKASVVLHADPVFRTFKTSACVAFPGPEWKEIVMDRSSQTLIEPEDDGARHRLWVQHTIKDRQWGYKTRIGAAFDLGRVLNYTAHVIDNKVEPRIPIFVWRVPLLHRLYDMLIPDEDREQMRYRISGVDLEASHEFGQKGAQLGVAKHFKLATVRGTWHTGSQEAGLTYSRSGVSLTAKIAKQEDGWAKPSLLLHLEPLGAL